MHTRTDYKLKSHKKCESSSSNELFWLYIKSVYIIPSNKAMLAVVQDKPGDPDVLYLGQVDKPTLGDNDVLIKV